MVLIGQRLKLIHGTHVLPDLRKGTYDGRLHVTYRDGQKPKDISVRIKAQDKEFEEER